MAASTLLSPDEVPTSTSTSSTSRSFSAAISKTLTQFLDFCHSILLYILQTLRRALQSVSTRTRGPRSTPLPSSSSSPPLSHLHTPSTATPSSGSASAAMTTTTTNGGLTNRLHPPKILPALPLIAPKRSSPEKDTSSKENTAPARKEAAAPLPQYQRQVQVRQMEPDEKLSERLDRLDLGDEVNGAGDTPNAGDEIISRPSSSSGPNPLPVFIPCPPLPIPEPLTGERAIHSGFMREALDMARLALVTNETPVGCVLVYDGKVIAKGMNATNITRNGTRHAELMAISALLSYSAPPHKPAPDAPASESRRRKRAKRRAHASKNNDDMPAATEEEKWGDVDPKDGHLYPYGQKLHPAPRVDASVISECVLYVTVEPCVMCASLLRQLRIRKVFFGAVNDKFGGTGGVFRIHMNAGETVPETAPMASAPPSPRLSATTNGMARPSLEPRAMSCNGQVDGDSSVNGNKDKDFQLPKRAPTEQAYLGGHGGNVEPGYEAEGGWGRDEAVTLLRQFYVQENGRAPIPRKKEGRAARLALMLERDGHAGGPMIPALPEDEETAPPSPSSSAADPVSPVDMDEA